MSNNRIILSEYETNVDVIDDFFKYNQKYRESYYRLNNTLSTYIDLTKNEGLVLENDDLILEANAEIEKYKYFDDGIAINSNEDMNEIAATDIEKTIDREFEESEILTSVIQSIIGKSGIDGIQYRILEKMYKIYKEKNNKILSENPVEGRRIRDKRINLFMNYIKSDSHLRDRYDTYNLHFNSTYKTKKEKEELNHKLKKVGLSNPYYISKIKNYDYLIDEEIEKVQIEISNYLVANDKIEDNKKLKIENRKNTLQFIFNCIVALSTFISLIVSILTYIYKD